MKENEITLICSINQKQETCGCKNEKTNANMFDNTLTQKKHKKIATATCINHSNIHIKPSKTRISNKQRNRRYTPALHTDMRAVHAYRAAPKVHHPILDGPRFLGRLEIRQKTPFQHEPVRVRV